MDSDRRSLRHVSPQLFWALVAAGLACSSHATANPPSFTGLGYLPGGDYSFGFAVSADSLTAAGYGNSSGTGDVAFRWTSSGGMMSLGTLSGASFARVTSIIADGSVVVGTSDVPGGADRAFRWTSAGGMQNLGTLAAGTESSGSDVSGDGLVVVGSSLAPSGLRAYRWTNEGGMVDLGTLPGGVASAAYGVSADGSVTVGASRDSSDIYRAFRWTSDGGMSDLGTVAGDTNSDAHAISGDGSVVVGWSGSGGSDYQAFRWTSSTGMVSLGTLSGGTFSYAYAANGDGTVVVGESDSSAGGRAFLWSRSLGMVDLNIYLPTLGLDLSGWVLQSALGVSADGLTIVGYGAHNGQTEAWIAAIPSAMRPPVARAGLDQSVDEGSLVTLDGSGSSDPDSDLLTYQWTQVAGPTIILDTTDPVHPIFTAPSVSFGGATLSFQLIVHDGQVPSEPNTVDVTVKNVNHPPFAVAGDDQTVAELSLVTLNGSGSFDLDGDPIAYSWNQLDGEPVTLDLTDPVRPVFLAPLTGPEGTLLVFELSVSDGEDSHTDPVSVLVESVNHPPITNAGLDQTLAEGATVTLDGTDSSDPDDDLLTFAWTQFSGPSVSLTSADGPTPVFTAPPVASGGETLVFELLVDDGYGGMDTDEVSIIVQNADSPPDCEHAEPSVNYLWPPNHKLVRVRIEGVRDRRDSDDDEEDDGCQHGHRRYRSRSRGHCGQGQVTITILGVTQDEPVNGLGDGDTGPDAVIQGETVLLRAERSGTGNGRVYHIHFLAQDEDGSECIGEVTVCVPHDNRNGACRRRGHGSDPDCVDDGQAYDSLGP